ncbi:MAG: hypothetical protein ACK5KP_05370 [Paludibacteraceae bacterium]
MYEEDGAFYFFAEDLAGESYELWETDGTKPEMIKVSELNTNESSELSIKKLGNILCFMKNDWNSNIITRFMPTIRQRILRLRFLMFILLTTQAVADKLEIIYTRLL